MGSRFGRMNDRRIYFLSKFAVESTLYHPEHLQLCLGFTVARMLLLFVRSTPKVCCQQCRSFHTGWLLRRGPALSM